MGKTSEQLVIDDITFETVQFAPMRSLTLLAKLLKTLGGAVLALVSAGDEAALADVLPAVQESLMGLDVALVAPLVCEILSGTTATLPDPDKGLKRVYLGSSEVIDGVFAGKLRAMFAVIGHALKVNFSNFSDGSRSAPAALPTQPPSVS